jgi:hypothetical protein
MINWFKARYPFLGNAFTNCNPKPINKQRNTKIMLSMKYTILIQRNIKKMKPMI